MSVSSCAPTRRSRRSNVLGRETCLSEDELQHALRRGGTRTDSDRSLGERVGTRDVLRPLMPPEWVHNPRTWLSNLDIDAVMQQYARLIPQFKWLGTQPVDFTENTKEGKCVSICSPSRLEGVYSQRMLASAIVNLDVHTGPGTHWVAFALDCRSSSKPKLVYYDPTGKAPPSRWFTSRTWAILAATVPHKLRPRMLRHACYNINRHQRKNTECGVFAIMMVDALLRGIRFEDYCATKLTDDDAFQNRDKFYQTTSEFTKHQKGGTWSWSSLFL